MNVKEIYEKLDESKDWVEGSTRDIHRQALGRMLLARMGQTEFKKGVFLERDHMKKPSIIDRVIHIFPFCHMWLEYDDCNVFDATRRICLICGRTESSIMRRDLAYYEPAGYAELDLKEVHEFIRKVKPSEDDLNE